MEQKAFNLETIEEWRKEIQGYWLEMGQFSKAQHIETLLRTLSSWSARSGYFHSVTVRSSNKVVSDFRTKEVDYFHDEVDRQFKIWSRIAAVSQSEWEMAR